MNIAYSFKEISLFLYSGCFFLHLTFLISCYTDVSSTTTLHKACPTIKN